MLSLSSDGGFLAAGARQFLSRVKPAGAGAVKRLRRVGRAGAAAAAGAQSPTPGWRDKPPEVLRRDYFSHVQRADGGRRAY